MSEDMKQMSKRYETSKGCETARKKKEHLKQGDEQKQIYILL